MNLLGAVILILALGSSLMLTLWPVEITAERLHAERTSYLWCLVALTGALLLTVALAFAGLTVGGLPLWLAGGLIMSILVYVTTLRLNWISGVLIAMVGNTVYISILVIVLLIFNAIFDFKEIYRIDTATPPDLIANTPDPEFDIGDSILPAELPAAVGQSKTPTDIQQSTDVEIVPPDRKASEKLPQSQEKQFRVVSIGDIDRYNGELLRVTRTDGQRYQGQLESIRTNSLVIRKRQGKGYFSLHVGFHQIHQVEVYR